ncbi:class I SAM-dependent RNA methyltransferase [Herbaspirillum sp. RTI4]|uniref:THUMP domain-containing class I SAM-dependent RNA methyltransferase n=1 Tax=Herbaspirillum sp. RTI4 TaxID=3048640 RepID=UPI002AB40399|nr:class I SAM-dependent RNA methyltransferase [Herbaspirillum sp. RTI4]MDY7576863.1 class I SAM-dependent RNA methyltransferase [Herbaspirillum sp. RTI4]MEA9983490.1 class I SAM-dependent RNA methyltransferase [Herbaspirillum sp. RTI4]
MSVTTLPSSTTNFSYFCPCPRGLEIALAEEIAEIAQLTAPAVTIKVHNQVPGGVHCSGLLSDSYRINLHSRIASRVLLRMGHRAYKNENDIYDLALEQEWENWFSVEHTLRVDVTAVKSPLRSLEFTTLKIKDAICDRFRDLFQVRPSVDTKNPDMRVVGFLDARNFTLYLDTSGEALFKRGWREETGEAPLRENLAAGLLRTSGWKPGMVLFDPMCGSGTILAEAAQILAGVPPGARRHFAFEKFQQFQSDAWAAIKGSIKPLPMSDIPTIFGSDISGDMVAMTRHNLRCAGILFDVPLKQIEAQEVKPPSDVPGIILTNPPYGERIGVRGDAALPNEEVFNAFFSAFGDTLKQRFSGWNVFLFSGDLTLPKLLRLKETRKTPFFNGALECRLFRFEMVAGYNRREAAKPKESAAE